MVELEKPGFDTAAFQANVAWDEESSNWRHRFPSFAGRSRRPGFLSSERPRKTHGCFRRWEGSYHHAPRRR